MDFINLVELAQKRARAHLQNGAIAVDATVGNGHDTVMLAEAVGVNGEVFGFDIQQTALTVTRERVSELGLLERVKLIEGSHADMVQLLPHRAIKGIDLVMFNLGYLPGGDKRVITESDSTMRALNGALSLLSHRGAISIIAYPGHSGGDSESEMVSEWCNRLDVKRYQVERLTPETAKRPPPQWFWIRCTGRTSAAITGM